MQYKYGTDLSQNNGVLGKLAFCFEFFIKSSLILTLDFSYQGTLSFEAFVNPAHLDSEALLSFMTCSISSDSPKQKLNDSQWSGLSPDRYHVWLVFFKS